MKEYTLGSLFDGSGTCPLAATMYGVRPVWASEIEPFAISVTRKHFPEMRHVGDITQVHGGDLQPVDIITGGSPCQNLSQAGDRTGLHGSRSSLFFEAVRVIREMREATHGRYPRYYLFENVVGALSSGGGEDFRTILQEFVRLIGSDADVPKPPKWGDNGSIVADHGSIAWTVLDTQFFNVPQRRKRLFVVVDLGGNSAEAVCFVGKGLQRPIKTSGAAWEDSAGYADGSPSGGHTEAGLSRLSLMSVMDMTHACDVIRISQGGGNTHIGEENGDRRESSAVGSSEG